MKKYKVGFLYLGPISHIYHSITIALNLSRQAQFDVTLFVSCGLNMALVNDFANAFKDHHCKIAFIRPSWFNTLLRFFKKRPHPRVRNVLQNNKKKLLDFDALVLTDRHFIKGRGKQPLYILTDHGAGDRARGYTDAMGKFDLILVSGKEKWDRMVELRYMSEQKGRIIGYPKFDIVPMRAQGKNTPLFDNNKPIVLYNPHFNRKETSWFLWGKQILTYFLNNKNYNLIFAPHLILFSKAHQPLEKQYYTAENIHVDINSPALIDMTYTISADIYLGDVSSQVYEFVGYKTKPCIFLNPHQCKWQHNRSFRMWKMGDVVDRMDDFEQTLLNAEKSHLSYRPIQENLIQDTFSKQDRSAGKRGAQAIMDFLTAQGR